MKNKKGGAFGIIFWFILGFFVGLFLAKTMFCS